MLNPVGIAGTEEGIPKEFSLRQSYPNPFNPETTIRFDLPQQGVVTLVIYNILGQEVTHLIDHEVRQPGFYEVVWNGRNRNNYAVASGIYFYRIEVEAKGRSVFGQVKKMTLLK